MISNYKNCRVLALFLLLSMHANVVLAADPDISVNPTEINFGELLVRQNVDISIDIKNEGRGPLNITRIDIIGDTSDIGIISMNSTFETLTLDHGEYATFIVYSYPKSSGTKNATVRIFSNDPDENPATISVTETVLLAILSISPMTLDFGTAIDSLTFQVNNAGDGQLHWLLGEYPDKPWITSVSPESGVNNATITVMVNRSQLSSTADTGTIMVNAFIDYQFVKVNIAKIESNILDNHEQGNPREYRLYQNFPNPFNPKTVISYSVPTVGTSLMKSIVLKIYDILGREVTTLINSVQPPGTYSTEWDGKNSAGTQVGSGIYFYKLNAGSYSETKKMLLLR